MKSSAAEIAYHEDVELRLRADRSTGKPVLFVFSFAIIWLLIGSVFGQIASLKLHLPDWLVQQRWLTFGIVRTVHLDVMAYGWASLAMVGVALWTFPRLLHVELLWPKVAMLGAILWNIGLVIGLGLLMAGRNNGMEWLELDRFYSVPFLVQIGRAHV